VAKLYGQIDDQWREWIGRQSMFFVGTAPLDADGHVNVSPKGPIGSLQVIDEQTVAYLDIVGSGAETIAHLRENGRIVVMLCAFQGPPRILRLHGRGEVVVPEDPRFDELNSRFDFAGPSVDEARRSVILVHVERIADSCGYGVPLLAYEGERPHSDKSSEKALRVHGPETFRDYERKNNTESIDGLPALVERQ